VPQGRRWRDLAGPGPRRVWLAAWSPDGRLLATSENLQMVVRVRDTVSGKVLRNVVLPGEERYLRGDWDSAVKAGVADSAEFRDGVSGIAFLPSGRTLVTTWRWTHLARGGMRDRGWYPYGQVLLYDAATGYGRHSPAESGYANAVWVAPDGARVLGGWSNALTGDKDSGWTVMVTGLPDGRELLRTEELAQEVRAVLFSADGQAVAFLEGDGRFSLRELATGQELFSARWGLAASCLTLSPDGQRVALIRAGREVSVVELLPPGWRPPGARLGPDGLRRLWGELGASDGQPAYRAVCALSGAPAEAVPFLRRQLRPVLRPPPARGRRLVADLDDDVFARREAAERELARLGEVAVPALRRALAERPSPEVRARAQALLKEVLAWVVKDPEVARALRGVWVLQRIGTPEALALLGELAGGAPEARQTQAAKAALAWLKQQRGH
jgi:hypothetical protein